MADTRPDIILPTGVRVDLYAALNAQAGFPSVTVGTKITFQNLGSAPIYVTAKATIPDDSDGKIAVSPLQTAANETGDSGAWVVSLAADGLINAGVAV